MSRHYRAATRLVVDYPLLEHGAAVTETSLEWTNLKSQRGADALTEPYWGLFSDAGYRR